MSLSGAKGEHTRGEEALPVMEQPETEHRFPADVNSRESKHGLESVEGNWKQVKGKIKEQWGKLSDDDLTAINGRRDQPEGKIQERYGYQKDQVKKDVDDWYTRQTW
jgi:uncharacterized protein YjbJ (UPF0337 family)